MRSPAEARRAGLVSVYQEPALIPDLDVAANLRLTETPVAPFRDWVARARRARPRSPRDRARHPARHPARPRSRARAGDRARRAAARRDDGGAAGQPRRAGARRRAAPEPDRPLGDLHLAPLLEISALCDRATVLRDGETVGVVDMAPGAEETIVELMLGASDREGARAVARGDAPGRARSRRPRRASASATCASAPSSRTSPSTSSDGEVLGVVALEGPGPGRAVRRALRLDPAVRRHASRSTARPVAVRPSGRRHRAPASPTCPATAPRRLLMQRSVRENIALPFSAALARLGADRHAAGGRTRRRAPSSGCRSTRAPSARCSACPAATSRR